MTYNVCKHVGIVSDQPENVHFSVLPGTVQGQQALGLRALIHGPCDYRQTAVTADQGIIDLAESGFLITGLADDASCSVAQWLGDALRALEDIRRGETEAANAVEGLEGERVEA